MNLTGKIANDDFRSVCKNHYIVDHHKVPRIWIVVADVGKVRIFSKPDGYLEQIGEASPLSACCTDRKYNHVLGKFVSVAPRFMRRRTEPSRFMHEIADWLDRAVRQNAYDRLVIAASPKMLGVLRKTLTKNTQTHIIAEVNKDLARLSEKELLKKLNAVFWF